MSPLFRLLLGACALVLTGCGEISTTYPVGTTVGLSADPALIGTWVPKAAQANGPEQNKSDKNTAYVHIIPHRGDALDIILVSMPEVAHEDGEYLIFRATTAQLGNNKYLNIVVLPPPGENTDGHQLPGSIPIRYRMESNGDLLVFKLKEDEVIAAITAGKIAGTVEERVFARYDNKDYGQYKVVTITADPAALDAFMAKPEAAELFKQIGLLKRIE